MTTWSSSQVLEIWLVRPWHVATVPSGLISSIMKDRVTESPTTWTLTASQDLRFLICKDMIFQQKVSEGYIRLYKHVFVVLFFLKMYIDFIRPYLETMGTHQPRIQDWPCFAFYAPKPMILHPTWHWSAHRFAGWTWGHLGGHHAAA